MLLPFVELLTRVFVFEESGRARTRLRWHIASLGYVLACFFLFVALLLTFVFYYHYGTLYNFCFCSPAFTRRFFAFLPPVQVCAEKKIHSLGNRAFSMPALKCVFC